MPEVQWRPLCAAKPCRPFHVTEREREEGEVRDAIATGSASAEGAGRTNECEMFSGSLKEQGERQCQDWTNQDQWVKDPAQAVVSDDAPVRWMTEMWGLDVEEREGEIAPGAAVAVTAMEVDAADSAMDMVGDD